MSDNQKPNKNSNNKWLALVNVPIQMGAIIFLFSYGGNWLDKKYANPHNLFVKTLTVVGFVLAFYNINRQLKDINKMDE